MGRPAVSLPGRAIGLSLAVLLIGSPLSLPFGGEAVAGLDESLAVCRFALKRPNPIAAGEHARTGPGGGQSKVGGAFYLEAFLVGRPASCSPAVPVSCFPALRLRGGTSAPVMATNEHPVPSSAAGALAWGGGARPPSGSVGGASAAAGSAGSSRAPGSTSSAGATWHLRLGENSTANNEAFTLLLHERDEAVRTQILQQLDLAIRATGVDKNPILSVCDPCV